MKRIIKKTYMLAAILLVTGELAQAQDSTTNMKTYIEVSYGPKLNPFTSNVTSFNNDQDQFHFDRINQLGTLGLRLDHFLNPHFSLGIDFYYQQRKSTGTMTESNSLTINKAEYTVGRLKTQIRLAYHFPISNPDLDVYIGGGVGINNQFKKLTINGQSVSRKEHPFQLNIPISLRSYAGLRYSFTKHFGVNAELGIGGPLFNAGFHYRF